MSNLTRLYPLFLSLILFSCTASNQLLTDDRLDTTFELAFKNIEKGKSKAKNIKLLNETLVEIITDISNQKDTLDYNTLEGKNQLFELDDFLIDKIFRAKPYIGSQYDGKLDSLNQEKSMLKEDLKKAYFEYGREQLEIAQLNNDKLKAQEAFSAFKKAEKYGNEASSLATLKAKSEALSYFVFNIKTHVPFDERYEFLVTERFREVETINRSFKKIYYNRQNLQAVDCQVDIIFDPLQIIEDTRQTYDTYEQQVATDTKITTNSDGSESETVVYSNVRAALLKKTNIKTYQWNVKVQITPKSNNCQLVGKIFLEEVVAKSTEIDITGDDRAIPQNLLNSPNPEIIIDNEQVDQLIEKIYRQIELIIL